MSFVQVSFGSMADVRPLNRSTIVFLNEQKFELGCIVSYMEGEFPGVNIIGISDPDESHTLPGQQVALAVIAVPASRMGLSRCPRDIQRIASQFPEAAIAIATQANQSYDSIMHELPGLRGVFPTSLAPTVVAAIIRVIIAGGDYFHRGGGGAASERIGLPARLPEPRHAEAELIAPTVELRPQVANRGTASAPAFTMRETQILQKLAEGLQNKLIAAALAMPENTVKVHVRNIMRKLKSSNRTAAVIAAQRLNVVMPH